MEAAGIVTAIIDSINRHHAAGEFQTSVDIDMRLLTNQQSLLAVFGHLGLYRVTGYSLGHIVRLVISWADRSPALLILQGTEWTTDESFEGNLSDASGDQIWRVFDLV